MKSILGVSTLAVLLATVPALADDQMQAASPAPAAAVARPHAHDAFRQTARQISQYRMQARSQMLGALTPAHRSLLATIAGQLAISTNPDPAAAAKQLDAALTPGESQAVLRAHDAMKTQARAAMTAARKQFEANMTADQRAAQAARAGSAAPTKAHARRADAGKDAGRILLELSMASGRSHR